MSNIFLSPVNLSKPMLIHRNVCSFFIPKYRLHNKTAKARQELVWCNKLGQSMLNFLNKISAERYP